MQSRAIKHFIKKIIGYCLGQKKDQDRNPVFLVDRKKSNVNSLWLVVIKAGEKQDRHESDQEAIQKRWARERSGYISL